MRPGFLLLLLLPALAWGEGTPSKAQLEQLKERISELSAAQNRELRKRDSVQAELREAELRISRLSREQRNLEQKAGEARQRLAQARQQAGFRDESRAVNQRHGSRRRRSRRSRKPDDSQLSLF